MIKEARAVTFSSLERLVRVTIRIPNDQLISLVNFLTESGIITLDQLDMEPTRFPTPEKREIRFTVRDGQEIPLLASLRQFFEAQGIDHEIPDLH